MADQGNPAAERRPEALIAAAIEAERNALHGVLDAPSGPLKPKTIHELRVAIRRLLTALELAECVGQSVEPRTARRLRKLLSRLSPARDAHVLKRALEPLRTEQPEAELVLAALRRRRRTATRKAKKRLARFSREDFDRDTSLVLSSLGASLARETSSTALAAVRGELARRHLSVERRRRSMAADDPTELHRVRVLLKQYRYALEATLPLFSEAAVQLASQCEILQEALGKAHDAHVLAETTRELARSENGPAAKALLDLAAELDRAARVAHDAGARTVAAARLDFVL